MPRSVSSHT